MLLSLIPKINNLLKIIIIETWNKIYLNWDRLMKILTNRWILMNKTITSYQIITQIILNPSKKYKDSLKKYITKQIIKSISTLAICSLLIMNNCSAIL
jgi:hypothetical protein